MRAPAELSGEKGAGNAGKDHRDEFGAARAPGPAVPGPSRGGTRAGAGTDGPGGTGARSGPGRRDDGR